MPELVHVINLVVRDDGSFRVCEVYIPRGFPRKEDTITEDVIDALVDIHDRVMEARDVMAAPIVSPTDWAGIRNSPV